MAKGLGKGLDALFSNDLTEVNEFSVKEIPIQQCRANPYQPRKTFSKETIEELKQSIIEYGVIQPIIVRKSIKGYEIVVGERRLRAAKAAELETIPAIVKELTDEKMMELALLENLQREDLTPIEEALAYANIIEELKITQEELSARLGKSRSHIANMIRLLSLPEKVLNWLNEGKLSMGHGRALLSLKDEEQLLLLAEKIKKDGLNVRQVEKIVHELNNREKEAQVNVDKEKRDIFILERESILREHLGTAVKIHRGKHKGKIEIEFYTDEDLNRIINMLEN